VNGYSSCTPVSDGERVFILSGLGTVAAFDLDGNRLWAKLLEKPTAGWGHSASPALVGGKLICHVRSIIALDPATGKQLWRTPGTPRWGSPQAAVVGDVPVIVTPDGAVLRAEDGKVLASRLNPLAYNSPMVNGHVAYFVQHGSTAHELSFNEDGKLSAKKLWAARIPKKRYYSSPAVHDGLLYGIHQAGHFSVIDAKTGKVVHSKAIKFGRKEVYPSVVIAGKHVLFSREDGTTVVMTAGREPKEVARNKLEPFRSCPVFVGDKMLIRGLRHLYCIGKK
jgi:outer membrane protein assembly factor BamB